MRRDVFDALGGFAELPLMEDLEMSRRLARIGRLALSAFVADAGARGCDKLYCLGDPGGFGAEVDGLWPILTDADITCVAGNYDVEVVRADPDCGCGYRDPRDNPYAQLICGPHAGEHQPGVRVMDGRLPIERRESIAGVDLHFLHGSAAVLNDPWWESLTDEHLARIAASGADVICCTHSGLRGPAASVARWS